MSTTSDDQGAGPDHEGMTPTVSVAPQPPERHPTGPGRRQAVTGIAVGVATPALVTILVSLPRSEGTAVPALLYLLGVVAAAAVGRLWPALLAAGLSFAGLN